MRFVILHYHILKNAGTTIENILDRNFGERLARLDTLHRDGRIEQSAIVDYLNLHPEADAVSSHQIHYPVPQAPGFMFFDLCFLRDPIDRLRSTYDYFRQRPAVGDPISDIANQLHLPAFVRRLIEQFSEQVDNPQVNLLANGEADRATIPEDLDRATERMLQTSFLGVVDRFEESIAAGKHLLRPLFPNLDCSQPPSNVSRGVSGTLASRRLELRETCGRSLYAELLRLTAMDCVLVRRARAEVRRRFQAIDAPLDPVAAQTHQYRNPSTGGFHSKGAQPFKSLLPPRAVGRSFTAEYYRLRYPELRRHPLLNSAAALFDARFYLRRYPDVRQSGVSPLLHYVRSGAREGRKPHPLFEPLYYLKSCPEAGENGCTPLLHFLESGAAARDPHPLFNCEAYLRAHPDVAAGNLNPLLHYLLNGGGDSHAAAGTEVMIWDVPITLCPRDRSSAIEPQQEPFFRSLRPDQIAAQFPNNSR